MAEFQFKQASITGMSTTLGQNKIKIEDEPFYFNNDINFLSRLQKTIGFGIRYQAKQDTTACDLCLDAALDLLTKTNLSGKDFDALIFITQTPDYYMPGNAHIIHKKLNCSKETLALDIELGCSGFVYGLWIAYTLIETGANRVLLLTGDTLSKVINPKDRTEAPLFCDVGCATIIERKENTPSFFILKSDGRGANIMLQPAGAYRTPSSDKTRLEEADADGNIRSAENFYMNGFETFNFTLTEQPTLLKEILKMAQKDTDDIDYFIFHQGNNYIVNTLARSARLPAAKVPLIFSEYGNQSSSSIPGTICAALSQSFSKKKQVVMQGFGIGLSWGACQLELNNPLILKPRVYGENNE